MKSCNDWIEFNCERSGYYRVNYDINLWNRIMKQLNENHTVDQTLITRDYQSRKCQKSNTFLVQNCGIQSCEVLNVDFAFDRRSFHSFLHVEHLNSQKHSLNDVDDVNKNRKYINKQINARITLSLSAHVEPKTNGFISRTDGNTFKVPWTKYIETE